MSDTDSDDGPLPEWKESLIDAANAVEDLAASTLRPRSPKPGSSANVPEVSGFPELEALRNRIHSRVRSTLPQLPAVLQDELGERRYVRALRSEGLRVLPAGYPVLDASLDVVEARVRAVLRQEYGFPGLPPGYLEQSKHQQQQQNQQQQQQFDDEDRNLSELLGGVGSPSCEEGGDGVAMEEDWSEADGEDSADEQDRQFPIVAHLPLLHQWRCVVATLLILPSDWSNSTVRGLFTSSVCSMNVCVLLFCHPFCFFPPMPSLSTLRTVDRAAHLFFPTSDSCQVGLKWHLADC